MDGKKPLSVRTTAILIVGCVLFALFFLTTPLVSNDISAVEVLRVDNPQQDCAAIVVEKNGGATTSFGYEVSVVEFATKRKHRVASLYKSTRNESAYGVNIRWVNANSLLIECLSTLIVEEVPSLKVADRLIKTELRTGVRDADAPSGGMEYNLRKKRIYASHDEQVD